MHIKIKPPNFQHLELIQDILFGYLSELRLESMFLMPHGQAPKLCVQS